MRKPDPQKMEAIFTATLKLVLREGFSALKMSDVAKEAGVATGTIYTYFEDKEKLIAQLYQDLQQRRTAGIANSYDPHSPFMIGFEKVWRHYATVLLQHPEQVAFLEQYYRSPYFTNIADSADSLLQPLYDLLERGKRERLVKNMPVELLVIQLIGAINELALWHHKGKIKAGPSIITKAFELGWDSVRR